MSFKLIETRELTDIQSIGRLYEHEATGAQVVRLANQDANKAFMIGFRTPPYNDNGIAHILEHSVLNGSQKFPSKEPFVELLKGSLQTFLNAMTGSDSTIYPVASTNQKDFLNLMEVYLDAVFRPNIYRDGQILQQEGWHYHLESSDADLIYKGVVYNEMKGANASPDTQLYRLLHTALYPNTCYTHNSGGDVASIPTLTQTEFEAFHTRYYHPSNSLTILYGDMEDDSAFEMLEAYFSTYERQEETVDLTQITVEPHDIVETYSLAAGDDATQKDYLMLAWHVANSTDVLEVTALRVLEDILLGNNQAPLKKALLQAKIGGDISSYVTSIGYPVSLAITAKYASATNADKFQEVVTETLQQLVQDGLDAVLIEAALNKAIFELRELLISESNPRGVLYAYSILGTGLYQESPFKGLEFTALFDQLTILAKEGYFECLIQEKLLDNPNRVSLVLQAQPGKNDAIEAALHEELQAYKASLSQEEIDALVETTQSLIERQETPDTPESLAAIPKLKKSDLNAEVEPLVLEQVPFFEGTTFYYSPQFTSGIDYVNLYIDVQDFAPEELALLTYLSQTLTKMPTAHHTAAELQTLIDLHTGGLQATVSLFEHQSGDISPYFVLHGKALEQGFDALVDLMHEVITETQFEDNEELLTIAQRSVANFERRVQQGAHALASNRALSQLRPFYKVNEWVGGMDQFNFIKEVRRQLQAKEGSIGQQLQAILQRLLNKARFNALYIGEATRVATVNERLQSLFTELPAQPLGKKIHHEAGALQREAFITSQDVNYVGLASDTKNSESYTGAYHVLASVVRLDYLWNTIRVKGGAYGAMFNHQRSGAFSFASYRDPNIRETLSTYQQLPHYIQQLALSEEDLTKYMIGAISRLEQPMSAADKGFRAFEMAQTGVTHEERVQFKQEVLATTQADLLALEKIYTASLTTQAIAVIGNKAKIDAESDLFDAVYELY
ncbi:MAG: insulinase family protein [Aerococcaceae bacterium]|nr:insulinase family protein [Aerococcaceae bacterium]